MRKKVVFSGVALAAFTILLLPAASGRPGTAGGQESVPPQVQKPRYDYNSGFLSRSTQPLGLREDPALRRLLSQGPVKWAVRAGTRQVLD